MASFYHSVQKNSILSDFRSGTNKGTLSAIAFSHLELICVAKSSPTDLARFQECRHPHTRLGFAYQLAFVRLTNRLPPQKTSG